MSDRGLTERDRLDRILQLLANSVGPELRQDARIGDHPVRVRGNEEVTLSSLKPKQGPDAQTCLKILRDQATNLFPHKAVKKAQTSARSLIELRNRHAHGENITATDVRQAGAEVKYLLNLYGLNEVANMVADLTLPPEIAYVSELRKLLVGIARSGRLITYDEVLQKTGVPVTDQERRKLYRQLNVLAAKQMILGEPQLCSLVVRADKEIPGDGYYWILDVAPNASEREKQTAHRSAMRVVYSHQW